MRMLDLIRAWAAITGLALVAVMAVLVVLGHSVWFALPLLIAGIVGFEMGLTVHDLWRRRRHG